MNRPGERRPRRGAGWLRDRSRPLVSPEFPPGEFGIYFTRAAFTGNAITETTKPDEAPYPRLPARRSSSRVPFGKRGGRKTVLIGLAPVQDVFSSVFLTGMAIGANRPASGGV